MATQMTSLLLTALLLTADFAAEKHRDQRRKNKFHSPYINHPIGTARMIAEIGKCEDLATLQGALLHDTVEDTQTTFEEIEEQFGPEVTEIVRQVTDDKSLSKVERKRLQVEKAPHKCTKAKIVKLADKLYNLQDLLNEPPIGWSKDRVQGYFVWSYFVVEGLRGTNEGLEKALDNLFNLDGALPVPLTDREGLKKALEKYYVSLE